MINPIIFLVLSSLFILLSMVAAVVIIVRGNKKHHHAHAEHEHHHPSPFLERLKQIGTAVGLAALPVAILWLTKPQWQGWGIFLVCVFAGFASTTVLEWLARLWAWFWKKKYEPHHGGHGDDFKSNTGYLVAYLIGAFLLDVVGGRLWSSLPHLVVLDTLPQIGWTLWNVCRACGAIIAIWCIGGFIGSFLNDSPKIGVAIWALCALVVIFVCSGGLTTGTGVVNLVKGDPVAFDYLYDRWVSSWSMWALAFAFAFFHEYDFLLEGKKAVVSWTVIALTVLHWMWVGQVILFNPYLIQTFQNLWNR